MDEKKSNAYSHDKTNSFSEDIDSASDLADCGFQGFRPKNLHHFRNILTFSIISGFVGIMASVQTYFASQIPYLEKQFSLNSAETGLIVSWSRIGYLLFSLFGSTLAQLVHIPLVLFWCMTIYGIAGFGMTIPYFAMASHGVLSPSRVTVSETTNISTQNISKSFSEKYFFCTDSNITDGLAMCNSDAETEGQLVGNVYAFKTMGIVIFSMCLFVMGLVMAARFPFTTVYIDDNVNKLKTGFYIGIVYGLGIFGPALAFTIGGAASKLYVTLEDVDFSLNDPRWIGAWWLGFIFFSVSLIITTLPLLCFPRRIKSNPQTTEGEIITKPTNMTRRERIKERLLSYWRVLTMPIYIELVIVNSIIGFPWVGYWSFVSKYITTQFGTPLWKGNMILAASNIVSLCLGCFGGGIISRKIKMTPRNCLLVNFIFTLMSVVVFAFGFFTGCNQPVIFGPGRENVNSTLTCVMDCSCDETEFFPICGSDGNSYHSPCYAGCPSTYQKNETFSNCTCIPDGMATSGLCQSDCPNLYPWAVVNFFSFFTDALTWIPNITAWIRTVEDRDKSTAIGLQAIIGAFLCFMPGPIAYGKLIDTTCLIWESTCGSHGSCLLYDIVDLRVKLHSVTVGMKFFGCIGLFYLMIKVWNVQAWEHFQKKHKTKNINLKEMEALTQQQNN